MTRAPLALLVLLVLAATLPTALLGQRQSLGTGGPSGTPPPPEVSPLPAYTTANSVHVRGHALGAFARDAVETTTGSGCDAAVEITASTGTQTAVYSAADCSFHAEVSLVPNSRNVLFFTTLSPAAGGARSSPVTRSIVHDQQPPSVVVDFPADGAELLGERVDVLGRVGDVLSGERGMSVRVNGVVAQVDLGDGNDGTFVAPDVPLALEGFTVLEATATDRLGNSARTSVVVTRVEVPPGTPVLEVVGGNGQTGAVGDALPEPLVVSVRDGNGMPFEDKLVTFTVTRSDGGLLGSPGSEEGTRTLQIRTGADGIARATWILGSDAGSGNHRVEASSAGVAGIGQFCASAEPGPAAAIHVRSGEGQRAAVGSALPSALTVRVTDGRNPVAGAAVDFVVLEGGGTVDGGPVVTVETTATGVASADFRLGPAPGNQRVRAELSGSRRSVVFTARALAPAPNQVTGFQGLVLDATDRPIGGARCVLQVNATSLPPVVTDLAGRFVVTDAPSGPAELFVDATVATHLDGAPIAPGTFPSLHFEGFVVVPNAVNELPDPIRLPTLEPTNVRRYSTTEETVLDLRAPDPSGSGEMVEVVQGLRMIIAPGSMTLSAGIPAPDGTEVFLNQVHFDAVPMPLPDGVATPFAWTLQPGGAHFDPPVRIEVPNMTGLAPGTVTSFLSFDHATGRFESVGTGAVSPDGARVVTDPGAGIAVAGWGGWRPPPPPSHPIDNFQDPLNAMPVRCDLALAVHETNPSCVTGAPQQCALGTCPPGLPIGAFQEIGGWIIKNQVTGAHRVQRFTSITPCEDPPQTCTANCCSFADTPQLGPDEVVIADYHTHPEARNPDGSYVFHQGPSGNLGSGDVGAATRRPMELADNGVDGSHYRGMYIVTSHDIWFVGFHGGVSHVRSSGPDGSGCGPLCPPLQAGGGTDASHGDGPGFSYPTDDPAFPGDSVPEAEDAVLDSRTVASALGRSVTLDDHGRFELQNVPVTPDLVRVTLVATRPEGPLFATSAFFEAEQDQAISVDDLPLSPEPVPTPHALLLLPSGVSVVEPGSDLSLETRATMSDGTVQDVSPRSEGTSYRSSSAAVASVDESGVVTGVGFGTAFVTASNQGTTTVKRVDVVPQVVQTLLEGLVTLDGSRVEGVVVSTEWGGDVTTALDGSFSVPLDLPPDLESLTVRAEALLGGTLYLASTDVAPVVDGVTDAGILALEESAAGFALQFDGINDLATIGAVAPLSVHTFECWARGTDASSGFLVVQNTGSGPACGEGIYLYRGAGGLYCYGLDPASCGTSNGTCDPTPSVHEWTHVAGTYDGALGRLYVNGEHVGTLTNVSFPTADYLRFGTYYFFSGGQSFFTGQLDEVRIWNHARTQAEIQATMHASLSGAEPGLVGYWRFDEGMGQELLDSSPSSDHGVLGTSGGPGSDDPTWVPSSAPVGASD